MSKPSPSHPGNPWNETNASNQTSYFDSLTTDIPDTADTAAVNWFALPNRLTQYLAPDQTPPNPYNYSQTQLWELADSGQQGAQALP
jgi:hypothetical protein